MYTLLAYDKDLTYLGAITPKAASFTRRLNSAGTAEVTVVGTDVPDDTDVLDLYRTDPETGTPAQKFSGRVTKRNKSEEEWVYSLAGQESILSRYQVPRAWEGWNGADLADVVKDHLNVFKLQRLTTVADLSGAALVDSSQEDIAAVFGDGEVFIETYDPGDGSAKYRSSAYVTYQFDLGAAALSTGRLVRWTETVGESVRIVVQSRSADIQANLAGEAWTAETQPVHVGDVAENETTGVTVPAGVSGHRWVQIKFTLYTTDTTTEWDNGGTTTLGYTPALHGFELIWREAGPITQGTIPAACAQTVSGFIFDRHTLLETLQQLCAQYEWDFRVRHDAATGTLKLDLGGAGGVPEIGDDRTLGATNAVHLIDGENATVSVLDEDLSGMVNSLHCWGAGEGADQLYYPAEDAASIAAYGRREGNFEDGSIDVYADLVTAGDAKLAELKIVQVSFEVTTDIDCGVGDTIAVSHPKTDASFETRVLEEKREYGTSGEQITLGLDSYVWNPLESLLASEAGVYQPRETPATPTQLTATPHYSHVVLTWAGTADQFAVRYRANGTTPWSYAATTGQKWAHQGLGIWTTWDYQVAAIKNRVISSWSGTVTVTTQAALPAIMIGASTYDEDCDDRCDGTADQVEIQAGIAALTALGGGILYLSRGTFVLTEDIEGAANITIEGAGDATVVRQTVNGQYVISALNAEGFRLRNLKLESTGNTHLAHLDGCDFARCEGVTFSESPARGLDLDECDDVTVERCTFYDPDTYGIYGWICYRLNVQACTFEAAAGASCSGVYMAGPFLEGSGSVSNCHFFNYGGAAGDYAMEIYASNGFVATGNQIDGGGDANYVGIRAWNAATISSNTISNAGIGIQLQGASISSISNNVLRAMDSYGIYLHTVSNTTVSGNNLYDCGDGIYLFSTCPRVSLSGNHVYDGGGAGITLLNSGASAPVDCTLTGNVVSSNTGWGITVSANCDYIVVTGNRSTNNTAGNYTNSATNKTETGNDWT